MLFLVRRLCVLVRCFLFVVLRILFSCVWRFVFWLRLPLVVCYVLFVVCSPFRVVCCLSFVASRVRFAVLFFTLFVLCCLLNAGCGLFFLSVVVCRLLILVAACCLLFPACRLIVVVRSLPCFLKWIAMF